MLAVLCDILCTWHEVLNRNLIQTLSGREDSPHSYALHSTNIFWWNQNGNWQIHFFLIMPYEIVFNLLPIWSLESQTVKEKSRLTHTYIIRRLTYTQNKERSQNIKFYCDAEQNERQSFKPAISAHTVHFKRFSTTHNVKDNYHNQSSSK